MARFYKRGDVRLAFILLLLLILLVLLIVRTEKPGLNNPFINNTAPGYYKVLDFNDGDTIVVDMGGNRETVRMIGVDTPETHRPETPVQCYGPEASDFTKKLIGNQPVRLEADPLNTNRDRYDRLLRYIYLPDGTLVEERLISEGYGFAYTAFPMQKAVEFEALEDEAERTGRGLWSDCQVRELPSGIQQTNPAS